MKKLKTFVTILLVLSMSFSLVGSISNHATSEKKAIFVLPGAPGSNLFYDYVSNPIFPRIGMNNVYGGIGMAYEILINPYSTVLMHDIDGLGIEADIDPDLEFNGIAGGYCNLITLLENEFGNTSTGSGEYDVVFFPYNFLGDLSESANRLIIETEEYDKVVLIAHSGGGPVAAAYIAKLVDKSKVEKAIFVATPLYGGAGMIEVIEFGGSTFLEKKIEEIVDFLGGLPFILSELNLHPQTYSIIPPRSYRIFLKRTSINSPGTYQYLPSDEYYKEYPLFTKDGPFQTPEPHFSSASVYEVFKKKVLGINVYSTPYMNTNLTDGNIRSHKYFRENLLGNLVGDGSNPGLLDGVDYYLIGNQGGKNPIDGGFLTPTSVTYKKAAIVGLDYLDSKADIDFTKEGDGNVVGFSASLGEDERFMNFPGVHHLSTISNNDILSYIIDIISGTVVKSSTNSEYKSPSAFHEINKETGSNDNIGMTDIIKLNIV